MNHGFKPNEANRKVVEVEKDDGMLFILHEPSGQEWTLYNKGKFGVFRGQKVITLEYSIYGVEVSIEDGSLYFFANATYMIRYTPVKNEQEA